MSRVGQEFQGLLPPADSRPNAAFFNGAGRLAILRDQLSISSWLCLGAALQGGLFLIGGRIALIPAIAVLLYRGFIAYAMATGWIHNTYMDGIIPKKISAQIPDEAGDYGTKPANAEIVVFLIGARMNHPLGILAPGAKQLGDYFVTMAKNLDKHADEFGFLGMTSWLNSSDRTTQSETLSVGYFRTVEGLHAFAHSDFHRGGWDWFNRHSKQYPHLSIFHETYHVPKGHWEAIAANSHPSGINSTTYKFSDKMTGAERWASPVVDASKGLLKTSAGRMSRSRGDEHEKYGADPY